MSNFAFPCLSAFLPDFSNKFVDVFYQQRLGQDGQTGKTPRARLAWMYFHILAQLIPRHAMLKPVHLTHRIPSGLTLSSSRIRSFAHQREHKTVAKLKQTVRTAICAIPPRYSGANRDLVRINWQSQKLNSPFSSGIHARIFSEMGSVVLFQERAKNGRNIGRKLA